jgi:hypothetical protein
MHSYSTTDSHVLRSTDLLHLPSDNQHIIIIHSSYSIHTFMIRNNTLLVNIAKDEIIYDVNGVEKGFQLYNKSTDYLSA